MQPAIKENEGQAEAPKKGGMPLGLVISFVISAGLLYYVFKDVQWSVLAREMHRINWLYLPLLIAIIILSYVFRAMRWRYLLPDGPVYTFRRLFEATWLGTVATFILPLRAGEFVRPWLLTRWADVRFFTAFASVVTERVFDVLAVLLLLAVSLNRIETVPPLIRTGAQALGLLSAVIIVFMGATYLYGDQLKAIFDKLILSIIRKKSPAAAHKLSDVADEIIAGLRAISSLRDLFLIIVLSLALWGSQAAVFYYAFSAFNEPASVWAGILVTVTVALAVAAPSAPGFLGTFQIGVDIALNKIYSYSAEFSLAYSLLSHVVSAITVIAVGALIMAITGVKFSDLKVSPSSGGTEPAKSEG